MLLLHIAIQNQVTKSARRIKLVSLSPRPKRCQTDLLLEASSHIQMRQWLSSGAENEQPGLHFHWADLAEGELYSCTEEQYLCITPHLPADISSCLLPFLPSCTFISPYFLPSLHSTLPPYHRRQEIVPIGRRHPFSPRGPATPAATCP